MVYFVIFLIFQIIIIIERSNHMPDFIIFIIKNINTFESSNEMAFLFFFLLLILLRAQIVFFVSVITIINIIENSNHMAYCFIIEILNIIESSNHMAYFIIYYY